MKRFEIYLMIPPVLSLHKNKIYMIIKRNKLIIQESLFSSVGFSPELIFQGIVDLEKILLLGDNDKCSSWTINHWVSHVSNSILHLSKFKNVKPSYLFLGFAYPDQIMKAGAINYYREIKTNSSINYFNRVIENISSQTKDGNFKYESILKEKTKEEVNYSFQQLLYIALRLTGQIDEDNEPWKINLKKIPKIDYTCSTLLDGVTKYSDIGNTLVELIKEASGGSSLSNKLKIFR